MQFRKLFCLVILFSICGKLYSMKPKQPLLVIFETDMGNDIDDALALDMLYKYQDEGLIKIAAISNNKPNPYSLPFVDLMNHWYGYPGIPMGNVDRSPVSEPKKAAYVEYVSKLTDNNNQLLFKRKKTADSNVEESVALYRKILSSQPDKSVVIISVGFLTNLSRLMNSPADKFSPLSGNELISKKVKFMSLMGGDFRTDRKKEFNIRYDIPAAKNVLENWPGEIYVSPWELGAAIEFPGAIIQSGLTYTSAEHPLKIAYEYYLPMPYNRQTWDLTSVLYAVEPKGKYFTVSKAGQIEVDSKGFTFFKEAKGGNRYCLTANEGQQVKVLERFKELILRKPKSIQ